MRRTKFTIPILVIAIAGSAGILVVLGLGGYFNSTPFTGTTVHFTIIEESTGPLEGMNGSYYHGFNTWPIIQVNKGDKVVINVMNNSTSEPHGFSISHYFPAGATISARQSYDVTFIATEAGNFTIYCNIQCSIHPFMEQGLLTVK